MELQEENFRSSATALDGINTQLNHLDIQDDRSRPRKKPSLPAPNLLIHPSPYFNIQSPAFSPSALGSPLGTPNNERSYLLENLQRQHDRSERLSHALSNVEVKLASVQSKGEARKLRKEIGLLRNKISESRKQAQLIMLRLSDLQNEELNRSGLMSIQAQQATLFQYPTGWAQYPQFHPWSQIAVPVLSPLSPLTPLASGIYQPSPIAPSPFDSPYWLGAQYSMMSPVVASYPQGYGQTLNYSTGYQQPFVQDNSSIGSSQRTPVVETSPVAATKQKSKSVDLGLADEEPYTGRRWSLADSFAPMPRDKRMSMPGLQTIWKGQEE